MAPSKAEGGFHAGPCLGTQPRCGGNLEGRRQTLRPRQLRDLGRAGAHRPAIEPEARRQVLDVATGTGWSARNAARFGANVTAIDISADLIGAARRLSPGVEPPIDYRVADAENLPFPDASFDKVLSTFGVIFARDHRRAAGELARVCHKGGRLCMSTWAPTGAGNRMSTSPIHRQHRYERLK